jgi:hypothetical protein
LRYQDFILQIVPNGADGFSVHVESPAGEDLDTFEWPFQEEVSQSVWRLLERLIRSPSPDASPPPADPRRAVEEVELSAELRETLRNLVREWRLEARPLTPLEIGRRLFQSLFPGRVRELYQKSLGQVGDAGLRIKLKVNPNHPQLLRLAALPWELLYDPVAESFLGLSQKSPIVRYLEVPQPDRTAPRPSPLRVLVAMASPQGPTRLPPLDLDQERADLKRIWRDQGAEAVELEHATLESLNDALLEGPFHVLHFMGHGSFDAESGKGSLALETADGGEDWVEGQTLSPLLADAPGLQLVFLNACNTARAADAGPNPFAGVATGLVRGGVPAVVAMQFPVSDRAAITFSRVFYRRLAAGDAVDVAITAGRKAIFAAAPRSAEWSTPVLFMRSREGALFESAEETAEAGGLLERYLRWLVEEYGELELPGLPQIGRRPAVPLDTVYVALRGDLAGSYERTQSRKALEDQARVLENLPEVDALDPEQKRRMITRLMSLVAQSPLPASIEERDRPQLLRGRGAPRSRIVTVGEAFRSERRMVILGDPGSGKTTLARWLTLQLATAGLRGREVVEVPIHHVDPEAAEGSGWVRLGPTRVPILVRVATFAQAREQEPTLTLAAFLGHHLAGYGRTATTREGRPLEPAALHRLLLAQIEEGSAVVVLDGLDEIDDPIQRYDIAHEIDRFIDARLPAGEDETAAGLGPEAPPGGIAPPWQTGGVQVVVTSRIVGYQMAPLSKRATHLTIEPMEPGAVDRFCDVWVRATRRAAVPREAWDAAAEGAAGREAEGLKAAIADLRSRDAGDLASNPLLVTILALVYQHGQQGFPRQRVRLYAMAVAILLEKWRLRAQSKGERLLTDEEVLAILVPLAAEVHASSGIGVIDDAKLQVELKKRLEPGEVAAFRAVLREEVGLLTARGEGVYGFLHLTFQEYLAACHLAHDRTAATASILDRLSSPRWREPILMALGLLSGELDEPSFEELLRSMLDHPDPLGNLLPRAALLIVAALPEMVQISQRAVERVAERLLAAAAERDTLERFPRLRQQVEEAYAALLRREGGDAVVSEVAERVLREGLTAPGQGPVVTALRLAAAELARASRSDSLRLAGALEAALPWDSAEWGWPIDHALRDLKARAPDLPLGGRRALGRVLLRDSDLASGFLADSGWVRLGMALYGGLDSGLRERLAAQEQALAEVDQELTRWGERPGDPRAAKSVERLNARRGEVEAKLTELKKSGHSFRIERMHRDVPWLTEQVVDRLKAHRSSSSLIPWLEDRWREPLESRKRGEVFLALVALGAPPAGSLAAREPLTTTVLELLSRVARTLEIVVPLAILPALATLKTVAEAGPEDAWSELVRATIRVALAFGSDPVNVLEHAASRAPLLAEVWQNAVAGAAEDPVYSLAVLLDTASGHLAASPMLLAQTFAVAHESANALWEGHRGWALDRLAPLPEGPRDVLLAALDALAAIEEPFDFVRGWALVVLAPLLREHGLLPEALILALGSLSDRFATRAETLQALLGQEDPRAGLLTGVDLISQLLAEIEANDDPYLRFRGYRQFLRLFSDLRGELLAVPSSVPMKGGRQRGSLWGRLWSTVAEHGETLAAAAPQAAQAIADPVLRAWACERLAALGDQPEEWMRRARQAALRIPARRQEQRARALARLAAAFPSGESDALLALALDDIAALDEERRAAALLSLRPTLVGGGELRDRFERIVAGIRDPGWRARAEGATAPLLALYAGPLAASDTGLSSLLLGATIHDLQRRFLLPLDVEGLWQSLGSPRREEALTVLRQRARSSGLRLTREAAVTLAWLLETGEDSLVREILPWVQRPDASVLPIVRRWPVGSDARARQYRDLLLAEVEDVSELTLPTLIELLHHADDRTRYRAALVLHGDFSERHPFVHASFLGSRMLHQLARAQLDRLDQAQISQVIGWAFERILHNDGRALAAWAVEAAHDTAEGEEALLILRKIMRITESAWRTFVKELAKPSPRVQRALLQSVCRLLDRDWITPERWAEIVPILQGMSRDAFTGKDLFLLDLPAALVEAADLAWRTHRDSPKGRVAAAAKQIFEDKKKPVSRLLDEEPEELRQVLKRVGDLVWPNEPYRDRIRTAAHRVEQSPHLLAILMGWLADELRHDVQDQGYWFLFPKSDLLAVLAVAAEKLPISFLEEARSLPDLGPLLREAARFQNTYTGRQAALILLSYLRRFDAEAKEAVRSGLADVGRVQMTAIEAIGRYREVDRAFLDELVDDLVAAPSAAAAYATGQVLAALARNLNRPPEERDAILVALARAVDHPRCRREVYLLESEDPSGNRVETIRHVGRLDQTFHELLLDLNGTIDLGRQRSRSGEERLET